MLKVVIMVNKQTIQCEKNNVLSGDEMKANAYCTLVALSINMLILPPASAAQQRHTHVYIEQQVTVTTTTSCRSAKDIVRDLGILCEALLEKPTAYHPQYIFDIFIQLIDEYMMACKQHASLKAFRNKLAELKREIETKKTNAMKILTALKDHWPQDTSLAILPAHVDIKLKALQENTKACFALYNSLQIALLNPPHMYQHKSTQEVHKALFKQ
jgi:hypothetical protein